MSAVLADLRQLGPTPAFLLMRRHGLTLEQAYEQLVQLEADDLVRVIATRRGIWYDRRWEALDAPEAASC